MDYSRRERRRICASVDWSTFAQSLGRWCTTDPENLFQTREREKGQDWSAELGNCVEPTWQSSSMRGQSSSMRGLAWCMRVKWRMFFNLTLVRLLTPCILIDKLTRGTLNSEVHWELAEWPHPEECSHCDKAQFEGNHLNCIPGDQ